MCSVIAQEHQLWCHTDKLYCFSRALKQRSCFPCGVKRKRLSCKNEDFHALSWTQQHTVASWQKQVQIVVTKVVIDGSTHAPFMIGITRWKLEEDIRLSSAGWWNVLISSWLCIGLLLCSFDVIFLLCQTRCVLRSIKEYASKAKPHWLCIMSVSVARHEQI